MKKLLRHPKDVDFTTIDLLLKDFNFECRDGKGSHYIYLWPQDKRSEHPRPLTIPKKNPVGEYYVKSIVKLLSLEEWYGEDS